MGMLTVLRFLVVFLVVLLPLKQLNANSFWDEVEWSFSGSIFYFHTNTVPTSDYAPIIPSLGFSAAYQVMPFLKIEVTEDLYFSNYLYDFDLGNPIPCSLDNRSAFVFGFVTAVQATGFLSLGNIIIRAYAGPAIDIRIIVRAFGTDHPGDSKGDETDAGVQTKAVSDYFWSDGRWFVPVIGMGMDFPVNEGFMAGFDLRAWLPIDNWRFGISFRVTPRKS